VKQLVLVLMVAGVGGVPVSGHHSFPSYYFEDRSVSIEGDIVEFDYRAPHAWVRVQAPDREGRLQTFSAEWSNPRRLERDRITRDTLKPRDHVIVTGSPGRNPAEFRIHLKRIERPSDGWKWEGRRRR
jgi:hypothetical protein